MGKCVLVYVFTSACSGTLAKKLLHIAYSKVMVFLVSVVKLLLLLCSKIFRSFMSQLVLCVYIFYILSLCIRSCPPHLIYALHTEVCSWGCRGWGMHKQHLVHVLLYMCPRPLHCRPHVQLLAFKFCFIK